MVSALACEDSDAFAAVAPVVGLRAGSFEPTRLDVGSCRPKNPAARLSFHGDADPVILMPETRKAVGYPLALATSEWGRFNECQVGPALTHINEKVTLQS